ncbi:hypothetical protein HG531_002675 [Fusarium graminearum]|nr:hypothetical protein HG531_002675 [Fusarium graminearum]
MRHILPKHTLPGPVLCISQEIHRYFDILPKRLAHIRSRTRSEIEEKRLQKRRISHAGMRCSNAGEKPRCADFVAYTAYYLGDSVEMWAAVENAV